MPTWYEAFATERDHLKWVGQPTKRILDPHVRESSIGSMSRVKRIQTQVACVKCQIKKVKVG